eukprot:scaffold356035_cov34-Prasinocladus_malaysianus.AAC.1
MSSAEVVAKRANDFLEEVVFKLWCRPLLWELVQTASGTPMPRRESREDLPFPMPERGFPREWTWAGQQTMKPSE